MQTTSLSCKFWRGNVEGSDSDKHSSLSQCDINYNYKKVFQYRPNWPLHSYFGENLLTRFVSLIIPYKWVKTCYIYKTVKLTKRLSNQLHEHVFQSYRYPVEYLLIWQPSNQQGDMTTNLSTPIPL